MSTGQIPKGRIVGFKPLEEPWSYYSLDDGTVLGIRNVLVKVLRVQGDDGKDKVSATDGSPSYYSQTQPVVQVLRPDEYKAITRSDLK